MRKTGPVRVQATLRGCGKVPAGQFSAGSHYGTSGSLVRLKNSKIDRCHKLPSQGLQTPRARAQCLTLMSFLCASSLRLMATQCGTAYLVDAGGAHATRVLSRPKDSETKQPSRPDISALGLFSCARLLELRSVAQRCPANSSSDDGKAAAQACTDQRETGHSRAARCAYSNDQEMRRLPRASTSANARFHANDFCHADARRNVACDGQPAKSGWYLWNGHRSDEVCARRS